MTGDEKQAAAEPQEEEPTDTPQTDGDDAASEAEGEAPPSDLSSGLEEAQRKTEEYLDQWRRTAAEFSNYKKRISKEQTEKAHMANAHMVQRLLPVVDDFERAFQSLPQNLSHLTWIEGIGLVYQKLLAVLEQAQVKPIETHDQDFDPQYHEAVTYEEVEGFAEGKIIGELQRGYILGETVLRPALVRLAKECARPPESPAEALDDEKTAEESEQESVEEK